MKWHELARSEGKNTRHVMGISGGKDSAALAVYIKDQYPDIHNQMEYFFSERILSILALISLAAK